MVFQPKHDYDSEKFRQDIAIAAANGMNDAEIADTLSLEPEVFSRMKNGKYDGWTDEQNEQRSAAICQVLARARRKTNAIVRGRYLKAAIGGIKLKSRVKRAIVVKCPTCGGADETCPDCGGTGNVVLTDKSILQETESETPPNMQALATWLYHHDPEWRAIERNLDDDATEIPTEIQHGVDITKWITDITQE